MCLVHTADPALLDLVYITLHTSWSPSKPHQRPYTRSDTRIAPCPSRPAGSIAAGYSLNASSYLCTTPDVGPECCSGVWCSEATYAPRPGLAQSPDSSPIHQDTVSRPVRPPPPGPARGNPDGEKR